MDAREKIRILNLQHKYYHERFGTGNESSWIMGWYMPTSLEIKIRFVLLTNNETPEGTGIEWM